MLHIPTASAEEEAYVIQMTLAVYASSLIFETTKHLVSLITLYLSSSAFHMYEEIMAEYLVAT